DRVLHRGDEGAHVGDPHDRVADELPGAVVGHRPPAVGLRDLDALHQVPALAHPQLLGVGAPPLRVDRRVVEEQRPCGERLPPGPMAPVWRVLGDEQLARAAGDGNDSAFAALYARYRPALRSYCASILLDQADAEDAVQATMLKAMRALGEHNGRGPLRPWLY